MSVEWISGLMAGFLLSVPIGFLLAFGGVPWIVDTVVAVTARERDS